MNLEATYQFVFDALARDTRNAIHRIADDDLPVDLPGMIWWLDCGAGEYRDLELTLDLLGNLDAPL